MIKKEKLLLILNHRLTNIRHDHLHHITSEIVKREPSFICIEDLNVKGMMKNRHLSKAVQQQGFYEFRRQMEYKSKWNNIQVIIADRFFQVLNYAAVVERSKDLEVIRTYLQM